MLIRDQGWINVGAYGHTCYNYYLERFLLISTWRSLCKNILFWTYETGSLKSL